MSELLELTKIELKRFFKNKKVILSIVLIPLILTSVSIAFYFTGSAAVSKPVRVCPVNDTLLQSIITENNGTIVQNNCELSFSDVTNVYYSADIYENTTRLMNEQDFAHSVISNYYLAKNGVTPTITQKTVLRVGDKIEVFDGGPAGVVSSVFGIILIMPVIIFFSLIAGNEYISTSVTTDRDRRILDIVSSYPLHRRNIILSKILVSLVFGTLAIIATTLSLISAALIIAAKGGVSAHGGEASSFMFPSSALLLMVINIFIMVVFTFTLSLIFAFKSKNPTDTSLSAFIVTSALDFVLMIPPMSGSLAIIKNPIIPMALPTLIPLKTALLAFEGQTIQAVGFTIYALLITIAAFKILMKAYEKNFE